MHCKIIISENEQTFINVEAAIISDDEQEAQHQAEVRFRQLIKNNDPSISEEDIEKCVEENHYSDGQGNDLSYELMIMNAEELIEV